MIFSLAKSLKTSITRQFAKVMLAGSLLTLTPNHALQATNGQWIEAQNLHTGNQLRLANGQVGTVENVSIIDSVATVYSLELENESPYFVGAAKVMVAGTCNLKTIYGLLTSAERSSFKDILRKISAAGGDHAKFINKIASSGFTGDAIKELQVALNTLDDLQLKKFVDDFDAIADVCKVNTASRVKAWEKAIDFPNVRKDIDFLTAFSKALDDPILKAAPINIETRFKDWITQSHLKCRTCANGTEPFLDDVLNNLYNFKDFLSKPGAIDVVNDLTGSTKDAIGANWLMKFTKDRGINPSAFEEQVLQI